MPAARREITTRELLLLAFAACLGSVVMNWPLVLNLGEDIPKDLGDPLVQAWQVAWGGHALGHQPLEFFQSNQFWPLDDALALALGVRGYRLRRPWVVLAAFAVATWQLSLGFTLGLPLAYLGAAIALA